MTTKHAIHWMGRALLLFSVALALPASTHAQVDYAFQFDQPASHLTWTGTTSLGPLEGDPSKIDAASIERDPQSAVTMSLAPAARARSTWTG